MRLRAAVPQVVGRGGPDSSSTAGPTPPPTACSPVVWSPAASAWGAIVNERTETQLATGGEPFMLTPLVIAMPEPMAEALGYPETPVGFADIVALAKNPEGWAAYGHPEWGPFRLGKTNPNFSTSGLNFTVAEYYAATGKSAGLTLEDLDRPEVESARDRRRIGRRPLRRHHPDVPQQLVPGRRPRHGAHLRERGGGRGEVDHRLQLGQPRRHPRCQAETPSPPKVPLVAIYPAEGTLFSDNPFYVLDAEWVTPEQRAGGALFETFIQTAREPGEGAGVRLPPRQPGGAPSARPIVAANGVDPNQPQAELEVPAGPVLSAVLDKWAEQRKTARVLLVLDVSGSMEEDAGDGRSKLELAKQAAQESLGEFKDDDEVGLWVFTTDIDQNGVDDGNDFYAELLPVEPHRRPTRTDAQRDRPLRPAQRHPAVQRHRQPRTTR